MDFIEVTSAKIEEIQKHQNDNKQLLDMTTNNAHTLELELKDKSQFVQGKYERICKDVDEVHTTVNQLESKIENIMKRVIKMNEVYETVFIERYKKGLDAKLEKKVKEIDEYKEKKKKMLDELADNFKKLNTQT